jgi:5-methyltetrahydrofolate--homocysteine methyltransferase
MISKQEQILKDISTSMFDLNSDAVKAGVNYALEEKIDAQLIIKEGLSTGMENIGNKFSSGEYFLSELIWAAHIMKEAMAILEPYLKATDIIPKGKIVIATVEGDLHDIGKNIAISLLKSAGFEIIDLGVDVSAEKILDMAKETNADIIALTALLSHVVPYMERTVKAINDSSIGNKVKILIGGRVFNEESSKRVGADAYAKDAWDGIAKAEELMSSLSK